VIVEAHDKTGKKITIDATELLAVILQHEIDHLDGKLLIDNVSRLKRNLYLRRLKKAFVT
jgi:peptide deformylase